jgi:hypothetical protein
MKKYFITLLVLLFCFDICYANNLDEKYTPTKKEWLLARLQASISGWNNYGHTIFIIDDTISYRLYYNSKTQNKEKAEKRLQTILEGNIKYVLSQYPWAKGLKVTATLQPINY